MVTTKIAHAALVMLVTALLAAAGCAGSDPVSPPREDGPSVPTETVTRALRCSPGKDICPGGMKCQAGECVQTCSSSFSACPVDSPNYCAELTIDANNCGAC